MAQADRLFCSDVTVFTLDGESFLGLYKNVEVTRETEEKESRAAKDVDKWPVAGIRSWSITGGFCIEGGGVLLSRVATVVALILTEAITGQTYSGNILIKQARHAFTENGEQSETLEGTGQGPLAKA